MPRTARRKSETGIHHIILRGINKQTIFYGEAEIKRFIDTLLRVKKDSGYQVYGYCFMNNHVHLLMQEGHESIGHVMKRIGSSYVYWYNKKHERTGYLFQGRFRSEPVEDDSYLLTVVRYIHQNPLKAGIVNHISDYKWSSYHEYLGKSGISNVDYILGIFNRDRDKAVEEFIKFHKTINQDRCLDMDSIVQLSDNEAADTICNICGLESPSDLKHLSIKVRDKYLVRLKSDYNMTIRQLEKLTGINRGVIFKA